MGRTEPILEPDYGRPGEGGAMHLLARAIALPLDPPVTATAEPPPAMRAGFAACGWRPA